MSTTRSTTALFSQLSCLLLCPPLTAATANATETTVHVPGLGSITGLAYPTYRVFLDIPYGQTTAGNHRWQPPLPYPPFPNTTLSATTSRDGCIGGNGGSDPVGPDTQTYSEDCLNLRVWSPPTASISEPLAVAVWLHGGGFMYGTTGDPMYNGQAYATQHNTVLVTLNYRLGALGFLATPNSGGDAKDDLTGNYGLLDQQLALKWVQQHISSFGGDPTRVLLFGQSAGAMSVICHLTSPLSKNLFQAVEIRSPVGLHYRTVAESKKHASTLATTLGCFPVGKGIVPCLRNIDAATIVKKQLIPEYIRHLTDPDHGINFLQWIPTVDGVVLPGEPHDIIVRNQTWNRVPMIIGSMRNETDAWLPAQLSEGDYKALFTAAMDIQWGLGSAATIDRIYNASATYYETLGLASTDWLMTCYVRRIARASAAQNVPTFLYHFLHYNSAQADPTNAKQPHPQHPACVDGRASCHAGDNPYALGAVGLGLIPNASLTTFEENISRGILTTTARLAAMVGRGRAAVAEAVLPLVPYDAVGQKSLAWGGFFGQKGEEEVVATVVEKFRSRVCDFWDTMTPKEV